MPKNVAFALVAHPDDIELMMAGTLALLGRAGYDLHVINIADGSCGSLTENADAIAARRTEEARAAANVLGAAFHEPIARDIEIFYEDGLLRKVASIVRDVSPSIMLLQSPQDYMEDHMNACRLGVTGAFTRGMPNYVTDPPRAPVSNDVTLYHALPWGLSGPLGERILPDRFVDISETIAIKREALSCHASQKVWLDKTQGLDSYLTTMEDVSKEVGRQSTRFTFAEGWRRHSHLGFCAADADPLKDALGDRVYVRSPDS
jgi:LmbE family N-acetylglucosaminyl deacetylase